LNSSAKRCWFIWAPIKTEIGGCELSTKLWSIQFQKSGVGAVEYKNLSLEVADTRFHEDGVVPRDATIVGNTWRFVNNNGTPDRRFKDNKEIPICRYSNLQVATSRED